MVPNADMFDKAIETIFATERGLGKKYVDVAAGKLHAHVGGYPSPNHRMPTCCSVMRRKMKSSDQLLSSPLKGKGAELKIRYYL